MKKGVDLEYAYAEDTTRGVLGLNATMFKEYLRFIANRRCQQIRVDALFDKLITVPVDSGDDRSQEGEELSRLG
jgi:ribonucleotide reductase beta subunit family protein with ferritin-like domain